MAPLAVVVVVTACWAERLQEGAAGGAPARNPVVLRMQTKEYVRRFGHRARAQFSNALRTIHGHVLRLDAQVSNQVVSDISLELQEQHFIPRSVWRVLRENSEMFLVHTYRNSGALRLAP